MASVFIPADNITRAPYRFKRFMIQKGVNEDFTTV